jgi:alpha-beta hydrolase superfamily lysophospholipase
VVHVPDDGRARGAVVICQPIGKEQLNTYRGVKQLAEKLCDQGLLVLRFDYAGIGDSAGKQMEPDAVRRWCDSIVEAVHYVRRAGAQEVALVGLRLGALLAASTVARCGDLCSLVLWDPVVSGRSYMREERALYQLSTDPQDALADKQAPLLGAMLHETAFSELAAMSLEQCHAATLQECYVLFAVRHEPREPQRLQRSINYLQADALLLDEDHTAFVTPPSFVLTVPTASIDRLATRVASAFRTGTSDVRTPIRDTVEHVGSDGQTILETLRCHGPHDLFAIHITPAVPRGPVVIFHGTASEHRVGPTRLWVELARDLAARGIASVRFDRRGIGDSGPVADNESTPAYAPTDRADAREIVRALRVPASQLLLVGLCSGAWQAASTAREIGARAAVLISLVEWSTRKSVRIQFDPIEMAETGMGAGGSGLLYRLRVRIKSMQHLLPYPLWRLLGRWHVVKVPEMLLDALWQRGVRTSVVLTPNDYRWFKLQRGDEGLRRMRARGYRDPVTICERGDHALYGHTARDFVRCQVLHAIIAGVSLGGELESVVTPLFAEAEAVESGPKVAFR